MPTYAFTSNRKFMLEQKESIVQSVTAIHAKEASAPRYFVQVVFYDVSPDSLYIGGEPAPAGHVWVNSLIRSGRTKEQKAAILQRIMRETADILDISPENVWVYVSDIPAESVAEFGAILPRPGGEDEWLGSLPRDLQEKLAAST